jgi:ketosteroid isomerase-like protein
MGEISDTELRVLLDKAQIHDALMRYSRGVDRGDGELVLSCFFPDATLDYGRGPMAAAALAEGITKMAATGAMHFIGNEYVEVDGDTAYGETYFISYATIDDGQPATRSRGGRYIDRFERRDGQWKIARRLLVDEWNRVDALPTPVPPPPSGRAGVRSKDDPVYTFRAG